MQFQCRFVIVCQIMCILPKLSHSSTQIVAYNCLAIAQFFKENQPNPIVYFQNCL